MSTFGKIWVSLGVTLATGITAAYILSAIAVYHRHGLYGSTPAGYHLLVSGDMGD